MEHASHIGIRYAFHCRQGRDYGADNRRVARIILSSTAAALVTFTLLAWALGARGA